MRGNKDFSNYLLGAALLALLVFMLVNQGSLSHTNTQATSRNNVNQSIVQGQQEECTVNSDDFLYSSCTGFYE